MWKKNVFQLNICVIILVMHHIIHEYLFSLLDYLFFFFFLPHFLKTCSIRDTQPLVLNKEASLLINTKLIWLISFIPWWNITILFLPGLHYWVRGSEGWCCKSHAIVLIIIRSQPNCIGMEIWYSALNTLAELQRLFFFLLFLLLMVAQNLAQTLCFFPL